LAHKGCKAKEISQEGWGKSRQLYFSTPESIF